MRKSEKKRQRRAKMSNLLIWNAGRSGPYKATAQGAWYGGELISTCGADMLMKHDKVNAHREFCQRHAWKLASMDAIERAIDWAGVSTLASIIGCDSSRFSKWRHGTAPLPPKHCETIANCCGLKSITPEALRPDLEFYQGAAPGLSWRKRSLAVGGAES